MNSIREASFADWEVWCLQLEENWDLALGQLTDNVTTPLFPRKPVSLPLTGAGYQSRTSQVARTKEDVERDAFGKLQCCSNVNHFVGFPSSWAQRASFPPLGVECCCLLGTCPPACLERYPWNSRDGLVPPSHTQWLWGSLHGWYRINSCGMEISWCIQLGTRGAATRDADYWLCQCLKKKTFFVPF